MKGIYQAVKVSDHVYWVGAIDWNIRDFHGYATRRGSTYNAYLILADRITLIDTVKAPFRDEMLSRISSIIDPRDIVQIVSNHSEMDHSGSLPSVIDEIRPEKVYASVKGAKALGELFHPAPVIVPVSDGDSIDLGTMTLSFLETRMLHWPDSMFSYLAEEKLLFSQDAFGMHLASSERFDDQLDPALLEYEGATYFANILLPYSQLILKLLERVKGLGYQFNIVAPDHGPVWRTDIKGVFDRYHRWAWQKPSAKALVVYATMWHSTEMMAKAIAEGLISEGISVKVMSMDVTHRSEVAYEVLDAGALVVGSPTLNNTMFPSMADVLNYLKGLRPSNLVGAAFGSYGWSGEAVAQIEAVLKEMKIPLAGESVKFKNVPDSEMLSQCVTSGRTVARTLKERLRP